MVSGRENGHQSPWHMSVTHASARSTRIRRCSWTLLRRQDVQRCLRIAPPARADRAGLRSALDYVRDGDVLIVWTLDRLGRSLPHLIETVTTLEKHGVGFRSLTEAIDTTTPGGRLVFHLFGALGQFERDLIRERTRAGLQAAAARGRRGGRLPVVIEEKLKQARKLIAKGLTVREAAVRIRVGKTALYSASSPVSVGTTSRPR
jgi:DNA invertase Pin-like site-specific DNA recombinase